MLCMNLNKTFSIMIQFVDKMTVPHPKSDHTVCTIRVQNMIDKPSLYIVLKSNSISHDINIRMFVPFHSLIMRYVCMCCVVLLSSSVFSVAQKPHLIAYSIVYIIIMNLVFNCSGKIDEYYIRTVS